VALAYLKLLSALSPEENEKMHKNSTKLAGVTLLRIRAGSSRKQTSYFYPTSTEEKLKGRGHSEDLGKDGKIILKWTLRKQTVKLWIGCIWLRIWTSDRVL
jgi:hypothetical protein